MPVVLSLGDLIFGAGLVLLCQAVSKVGSDLFPGAPLINLPPASVFVLDKSPRWASFPNDPKHFVYDGHLFVAGVRIVILVQKEFHSEPEAAIS